MGSRYEIAPPWVRGLVAEVRQEFFKALEEAEILPLFDRQPRKVRGQYVMATLRKAGDMHNALGSAFAGLGWHYVLILDKTIFMRLSDEDRRLLLRHELSHAEVVVHESGDETYTFRGHDYELFSWELDLPDWREVRRRWRTLIYQCYEIDAALPPENDPTRPRLPFTDPIGEALGERDKEGEKQDEEEQAA